MPDLDQVLEPRVQRERRDPPYPVVLEGTYVSRSGEGYVRLESAALVGPIVGDDALSDGELVVVAVAQTGVPYVIFPHG